MRLLQRQYFHLQVVRCFVHLVCDLFNHYPLKWKIDEYSYIIAHIKTSISTHLRFDFGIHVERDVLKARNSLADLVQLCIQFPD